MKNFIPFYRSNLPEDLTARIKAMLQGDGADNLDSDEKSPPVTKPLVSKANKLRAEIEEAFPLSDRSAFYSKLLRRNRTGGGHQHSPSETQNTSVQESLGTYVALDPSKKNSIAEKQKVRHSQTKFLIQSHVFADLISVGYGLGIIRTGLLFGLFSGK